MLMRQTVVRTISILLVLGASAGCGMRSTLTETDQSLSSDESGAENGTPCGGGVAPCDPADLAGATCESVGAGTGNLGCDPVMCLYDTSMCSGDYAGGVGGTGATGTGGTDVLGDLIGTLFAPPAAGDEPAADLFSLLFPPPAQTDEEPLDLFGLLFGGAPEPDAPENGGAASDFQDFLDSIFGSPDDPADGESQNTGGSDSAGDDSLE